MTSGTTPRSDISTVSVVIAIEDINDNDPVWTDSTPGPIILVEVMLSRIAETCAIWGWRGIYIL